MLARVKQWLKRENARQFPLLWVTDNIAISRAPRENEWRSIADDGIQVVLCLAAEGQDDSAVARAAGLEYRRAPILDHSAPSVSELAELSSWVLQNVNGLRNVLIHCREGRGRSPMVACAVLVTTGLSLPAAFSLVARVQSNFVFSDVQTEALKGLEQLLKRYKVRRISDETKL